jgi:flagellar protein FlgJ
MEIKPTVLPQAANENVDLQALKNKRIDAEKNNAAAKKVAKEFEAMFVSMMLKSMRETVGKDKLTGGGHGEEIYRSLLDQEYARAVAENGGLGLARTIEAQLLSDDRPVKLPDRRE